MTYDLINEIHLWQPTGKTYEKWNPNRQWWQFWKPKVLQMQILIKHTDDGPYRVGYSNDGTHVVAEALSYKF